MPKATFYWPKYSDYTTEIELTKEGEILYATSLMDDLGIYKECTKEMKERVNADDGIWKRRIDDFIRDHDWSDHGGEEKFESYKDMMGSVFRGESA